MTTILAIETSCDETAISVVNFDKFGKPKVLSHLVSSQAKIHEPFGGVVPNLASREHQTNLIPILKQALSEAELLNPTSSPEHSNILSNVRMFSNVLGREPELSKQFTEFIPTITLPAVDAIAVTVGPGLEPALWVGINFAKALALVWQKPLIPVNHMEGHLFSVLNFGKFEGLNFPAIALLVSGGHTELILMKSWGQYELLGQTRDDAVGEAFDKVARLLGLPYPGGPQISALAEKAKNTMIYHSGNNGSITLPRPMLDSKDYDFSFSGLKTAVRYKIESLGKLTNELKKQIAHEFQEAVIEVLVKKTMRAVKEYGAKTLIIGGGVIANKRLRAAFGRAVGGRTSDSAVRLLIPEMRLTTDNATMIALAAFQHLKSKTNTLPPRPEVLKGIRAEGNLKVC